MSENIKKPIVQLVGKDGNAYAIMARVRKALKDAGFPDEHITAYLKEAMSGDYDNLLQVSMKYVEVE